jgi:hypothetical protein
VNTILGALVLVLASMHANTHDAADAIETWTEEKLARVARRQKTTETVIWSARCERRGMDTLAKRADAGDWKLHCVERRVLKVPGGA